MTIDKSEFENIKRKQWDAFEYRQWFTDYKGRIIDKFEKRSLLRAFEGKKYKKCLDVGVGNGRQISTYSDFVDDLLAIDISKRQLIAAEKFSKSIGVNARFELCSDASELGYEDESFDLIICTRVLQHLYDWKKAVRGFQRLLKPGGDLVLITYNRFSLYGIIKLLEHKLIDPLKGDIRNPIGLLRELKRSNFSVDYYAGGLIGQPVLFPKRFFKLGENFLYFMETLDKKKLFKYIGERQIVRARKI